MVMIRGMRKDRNRKRGNNRGNPERKRLKLDEDVVEMGERRLIEMKITPQEKRQGGRETNGMTPKKKKQKRMEEYLVKVIPDCEMTKDSENRDKIALMITNECAGRDVEHEVYDGRDDNMAKGVPDCDAQIEDDMARKQPDFDEKKFDCARNDMKSKRYGDCDDSMAKVIPDCDVNSSEKSDTDDMAKGQPDCDGRKLECAGKGECDDNMAKVIPDCEVKSIEKSYNDDMAKGHQTVNYMKSRRCGEFDDSMAKVMPNCDEKNGDMGKGQPDYDNMAEVTPDGVENYANYVKNGEQNDDDMAKVIPDCDVQRHVPNSLGHGFI